MSEALAAEGPVKTYRAGSIEELLPQIRAELGPGAVIVRQREGLVGGIGGFFQKRCVEVEARPGGPRVDVYDDGEAPDPELEAMAREPHPVRNDAATREGLTTPAMRQLVGQAQPFAEMLDELGAEPTPEPDAVVLSAACARKGQPQTRGSEDGGGEEAAPAGSRPQPRRAAALREGLIAAGLGADLAAEIVDSVLASRAPFASPGRLRTMVRDELALRLPVAPAAAPGRRSLALVGPAGAGKTAALARIAAAHAAAGDAVTCLSVEPSDGGAALRALLAGSGVAAETVAAAELGAAMAGAELVLIDTPAAWPGADGVTALGSALAAAAVGEVHLALRAGTAAAAGSELLDGLRPLGPNRLLLTGAAESGHLGGPIDVAIRAGLPLSYVAAGAGEVAPAEARALASRVTP